jgi:hypothetical protein
VTKVYDAIRRPAANRVIELSRLAGRLCGINTADFADAIEGGPVEVGRLRNLVNTISVNWEWSWKDSAEDDKRRALDMLAHQVSEQSVTHTVPPVTISEKHHGFPAKSLGNQFFFLCGITASAALALMYFAANTQHFLNVRHYI